MAIMVILLEQWYDNNGLSIGEIEQFTRNSQLKKQSLLFKVSVIYLSLGLLVLAELTSLFDVQAADQQTAHLALQQDGPDAPEPFTQEDLQLLSGNVLRPNGMFWHEGNLYVGCNGDFTIYRVDDTTGATITYIAGVENVNELYVEGTTDNTVLWVPDYSRDTLTLVRRGEPSPRTDVISDMAAPWGIESVGDDFLLTQFRNDEVVRATRDGQAEVIATGFRSPTGIVADGSIVFVANHESARRSIEWFDLEDTADGPLTDTDMQQLVKGLQFTTNLVMGPDGMLYFAYALGQRGVVGRVDPQACIEAGGCSNIDVEPVVWTELQAPLVGLNITPDMRLFIHSQYGAEIYWLQLPDDSVVRADATP